MQHHCSKANTDHLNQKYRNNKDASITNLSFLLNNTSTINNNNNNCVSLLRIPVYKVLLVLIYISVTNNFKICWMPMLFLDTVLVLGGLCAIYDMTHSGSAAFTYSRKRIVEIATRPWQALYKKFIWPKNR